MKISVVGAGNAGCFTALNFGWQTRKNKDIEVELIHDPNINSERVGQATLPDALILLHNSMQFDWYNNSALMLGFELMISSKRFEISGETSILEELLF